MAQFAIFTRADAPTFQKLLLWLIDLPAPGTHVGGGRHVDMPEQPPARDRRDWPGWTTRYVDWVAHPANTGAPSDQFAVRITQPVREAWLAKRSRLTAAQRTWVQAHLDIAADLDATWTPAPGADDPDPQPRESEEIVPEA